MQSFQMRGVPFTKENARSMAAKAVLVRAADREAGRVALETVKALPPPTLQCRADRLAKQMDLLEHMMVKEKDSKELANLTAAHARLFDAWCILTGTQLPSKAKVSRRSIAAPIAPIESPAPASDKPCPTPVATPLDPAAPKSEDCTG